MVLRQDPPSPQHCPFLFVSKRRVRATGFCTSRQGTLAVMIAFSTVPILCLLALMLFRLAQAGRLHQDAQRAHQQAQFVTGDMNALVDALQVQRQRNPCATGSRVLAARISGLLTPQNRKVFS